MDEQESVQCLEGKEGDSMGFVRAFSPDDGPRVERQNMAITPGLLAARLVAIRTSISMPVRCLDLACKAAVVLNVGGIVQTTGQRQPFGVVHRSEAAPRFELIRTQYRLQCPLHVALSWALVTVRVRIRTGQNRLPRWQLSQLSRKRTRWGALALSGAPALATSTHLAWQDDERSVDGLGHGHGQIAQLTSCRLTTNHGHWHRKHIDPNRRCPVAAFAFAAAFSRTACGCRCHRPRWPSRRREKAYLAQPR